MRAALAARGLEIMLTNIRIGVSRGQSPIHLQARKLHVIRQNQHLLIFLIDIQSSTAAKTMKTRWSEAEGWLRT